MSVTRRHSLAAGCTLLLLSGCGSSTPPRSFDAFEFDYLTKIKLDVARVDVDADWAPRGGGRHVEYLAPTRPLIALRRMAEDRLIPGGNKGAAAFVIDDASIVQARTRYEANFAAHLDLLADDGTRLTTVTFRTSGVRPITDSDDKVATQTDLYELTRKLMDEMNVELEFQLRKTVREQLQTTSPEAPAPGAVETQDLAAPRKL